MIQSRFVQTRNGANAAEIIGSSAKNQQGKQLIQWDVHIICWLTLEYKHSYKNIAEQRPVWR